MIVGFRNLVFVKKLIVQSPRCISNHFIDISAVPNGLVALVFIHDCSTFIFVGKTIAADYRIKNILNKHFSIPK